MFRFYCRYTFYVCLVNVKIFIDTLENLEEFFSIIHWCMYNVLSIPPSTISNRAIQSCTG